MSAQAARLAPWGEPGHVAYLCFLFGLVLSFGVGARHPLSDNSIATLAKGLGSAPGRFGGGPLPGSTYNGYFSLLQAQTTSGQSPPTSSETARDSDYPSAQPTYGSELSYVGGQGDCYSLLCMRHAPSNRALIVPACQLNFWLHSASGTISCAMSCACSVRSHNQGLRGR